MKAYCISDIKTFMAKLLIRETFDLFCLSELTLTTSVTYTIDGLLHPAYFEGEEGKTLSENYSSWKKQRPFILSLIRGKHTPIYFQILFRAPKTLIKQLLSQEDLPILPEDITGLFLNCRFDGGKLTCVTGTSQRQFTMDKSLDQVWDQFISTFFDKEGVSWEEG